MSIYGQAEKPLFFVYQTSQLWIRSDSVGGSTNLNLPISMAQRELAEEHEDVILITPVYPVSSYTDEHLSSNGYAWYGEYIAKAIWQTLNKEINFSNTKIKKVVKSGNKIYISCQVPVMPLQIDTYTLPEQKNYGFQVLDGTKEVNILSVSVQSSGIVLTLDADVSKIDDLSVSYAGRYRNGRGNICDSDEWVSAEIYKDDSSDQGDDGDLSIGQRPHDKNGNSLVGKHYPSKNFLGNFYIEL